MHYYSIFSPLWHVRHKSIIEAILRFWNCDSLIKIFSSSMFNVYDITMMFHWIISSSLFRYTYFLFDSYSNPRPSLWILWLHGTRGKLCCEYTSRVTLYTSIQMIPNDQANEVWYSVHNPPDLIPVLLTDSILTRSK